MKISELATKTNWSAHTLRYYERIGLMPRAHRAANGHRIYDETTFTWLEFLRRLKTTGMPIKQMQRYAKLRQTGMNTEPERMRILKTHRAQLQHQIEDLLNSAAAIDKKIRTYDRNIRVKGTKNEPAR